MKIAVAYNNGDISLSFGHTKVFKMYEVKAGEILDSYIIETEATGHLALSQFLHEENVDALIARNIGAAARFVLKEERITYFAGVVGNSDEAVKKFLKGELVYEQHYDEKDNSDACNSSCNACSGCH